MMFLEARRVTEDDPLRFLFAKAFEYSVPGDDCPSSDALLDAYHAQGDAASRGVVADHLASCPVCAEVWRLALLADERDSSA